MDVEQVALALAVRGCPRKHPKNHDGDVCRGCRGLRDDIRASLREARRDGARQMKQAALNAEKRIPLDKARFDNDFWGGASYISVCIHHLDVGDVLDQEAPASPGRRRLENKLEAARTVARTTHAVAKDVLTESWGDPYNQVPGSKCCEITNSAWTGLDQTVRANEEHHDWVTDDADEPAGTGWRRLDEEEPPRGERILVGDGTADRVAVLSVHEADDGGLVVREPGLGSRYVGESVSLEAALNATHWRPLPAAPDTPIPDQVEEVDADG